MATRKEERVSSEIEPGMKDIGHEMFGSRSGKVSEAENGD